MTKTHIASGGSVGSDSVARQPIKEARPGMEQTTGIIGSLDEWLRSPEHGDFFHSFVGDLDDAEEIANWIERVLRCTLTDDTDDDVPDLIRWTGSAESSTGYRYEISIEYNEESGDIDVSIDTLDIARNESFFIAGMEDGCVVIVEVARTAEGWIEKLVDAQKGDHKQLAIGSKKYDASLSREEVMEWFKHDFEAVGGPYPASKFAARAATYLAEGRYSQKHPGVSWKSAPSTLAVVDSGRKKVNRDIDGRQRKANYNHRVGWIKTKGTRRVSEAVQLNEDDYGKRGEEVYVDRTTDGKSFVLIYAKTNTLIDKRFASEDEALEHAVRRGLKITSKGAAADLAYRKFQIGLR